MILDAGFLVTVDRGERAAEEFLVAALAHRTPLTTHPVVAQVWHDGARQARLARFLQSVVVVTFNDGYEASSLLARSGTSDMIGAHLVVGSLAERRPTLFGWPQ